ncbi:MAG: NUDIX domain-containing protein, partial [Pseudomonadota bacterium]
MAIKHIIRSAFHFYFLMKRSMTLGVRLLVENEKGEVLLVRHTYVDGWYLPGGGVERGETAEAAARKELLEETGFKVGDNLILLGVYKNLSASKRDHVLLFRVQDWTEEVKFSSN